MTYHPCAAKRPNGFACRTRGVVVRGKKWFCRHHDPGEPDLKPLSDGYLTRLENAYLDAKGRQLTADEHQRLNDRFKKAIPRLVKELMTLRGMPTSL